MRYYKTTNQYKNRNSTNMLDLTTHEARSYDWWIYLKVINNKKVFNEYYYSPTTSRHQYYTKTLLQELGEDLSTYIYVEAPRGLQDLDSAIEHYKHMILDLRAQIAKPGTRATKNEERLEQINEYQAKIQQIKELQK